MSEWDGLTFEQMIRKLAKHPWTHHIYGGEWEYPSLALLAIEHPWLKSDGEGITLRNNLDEGPPDKHIHTAARLREAIDMLNRLTLVSRLAGRSK